MRRVRARSRRVGRPPARFHLSPGADGGTQRGGRGATDTKIGAMLPQAEGARSPQSWKGDGRTLPWQRRRERVPAEPGIWAPASGVETTLPLFRLATVTPGSPPPLQTARVTSAARCGGWGAGGHVSPPTQRLDPALPPLLLRLEGLALASFGVRCLGVLALETHLPVSLGVWRREAPSRGRIRALRPLHLDPRPTLLLPASSCSC